MFSLSSSPLDGFFYTWLEVAISFATSSGKNPYSADLRFWAPYSYVMWCNIVCYPGPKSQHLGRRTSTGRPLVESVSRATGESLTWTLTLPPFWETLRPHVVVGRLTFGGWDREAVLEGDSSTALVWDVVYLSQQNVLMTSDATKH